MGSFSCSADITDRSMTPPQAAGIGLFDAAAAALLLPAGPLRLRGEPQSGGAAEGGAGTRGEFAKFGRRTRPGRPGRRAGSGFGLSGGGGSAARAAPAWGRRVRRTSAPPPPPPSHLRAAAAASGAADREAGGGRPGPGGVPTAPSEEEVCACRSRVADTKLPAWSRLQTRSGAGEECGAAPRLPRPELPAPRAGTDFEGEAGAAAPVLRRASRRRLALRLGLAPTARARLSLRAGLAGPRPCSRGRAARA